MGQYLDGQQRQLSLLCLMSAGAGMSKVESSLTHLESQLMMRNDISFLIFKGTTSNVSLFRMMFALGLGI